MARVTREVVLPPKLLQVALYLGWHELRQGRPASLRQVSAALGHPLGSVHRWVRRLVALEVLVADHQKYLLQVWPRPVGVRQRSREGGVVTSAPPGTGEPAPAEPAEPLGERGEEAAAGP